MEEIQGAAACSFNPLPILQDSMSCVLLLFPEYNASCKRDLVLDKPDLQHMQRNDTAMISQICNVNPEDVATTRSNKLLAKLEIVTST